MRKYTQREYDLIHRRRPGDLEQIRYDKYLSTLLKYGWDGIEAMETALYMAEKKLKDSLSYKIPGCEFYFTAAAGRRRHSNSKPEERIPPVIPLYRKTLSKKV